MEFWEKVMREKILVVDDYPENRYMLESLLKGVGYAVLNANDGEEALAVAREQLPDLILSDILMPVMDGYQLCREIRQDAILTRTPFIFYTATYTEPKDEAFALELGADCFLVKPTDPEVLLKQVSELIHSKSLKSSDEVGVQPTDSEFHKSHNDVIFRKLEKKIKELETLNQLLSKEMQQRELANEKVLKLSDAIEKCPLAIAITRADGTLEFVNQKFCQRQNIQPDVIQGVLPKFVLREDSVSGEDGESGAGVGVSSASSSDAKENQSRISIPHPVREVKRYTTKEGVECVESIQLYPIVDAQKQITNIIIIVEDITHQARMERELARTQRMEELALLTAGVAHDFNNILGGILGYAELALMQLDDLHQCRQALQSISDAAGRATKMTRTLLDFSRKHEPKKEKHDFNEILRDFRDFLRHMLPVEMTLTLALSDGPLWICADKVQIEQMLLNFVINARDAIDSRGEIVLSTEKAGVSESEKAFSSQKWFLFQVKDTGRGMTQETLDHLYEPFYTTKPEGQGTGLGLSLIKGIIDHHEGRIEVNSQLGEGTVFKLFFPLME
jgi:signal transduction histidine kinase/DNA-binding response OmpR family regulator